MFGFPIFDEEGSLFELFDELDFEQRHNLGLNLLNIAGKLDGELVEVWPMGWYRLDAKSDEAIVPDRYSSTGLNSKAKPACSTYVVSNSILSISIHFRKSRPR